MILCSLTFQNDPEYFNVAISLWQFTNVEKMLLYYNFLNTLQWPSTHQKVENITELSKMMFCLNMSKLGDNIN